MRKKTRMIKWLCLLGALLLTASCVGSGTREDDGSGLFSVLAEVVNVASSEQAADAVDTFGEILTWMGLGAAGGGATLLAQAMRRRARERSKLKETTLTRSTAKDSGSPDGNAEAEEQAAVETEAKMGTVDKGALAAIVAAADAADI